MGSKLLPEILILEPSLTFTSDEINNLFYRVPPAAPRDVPQVPNEVELQQANAGAVAPAIHPPPQAP